MLYFHQGHHHYDMTVGSVVKLKDVNLVQYVFNHENLSQGDKISYRETLKKIKLICISLPPGPSGDLHVRICIWFNCVAHTFIVGL